MSGKRYFRDEMSRKFREGEIREYLGLGPPTCRLIDNTLKISDMTFRFEKKSFFGDTYYNIKYSRAWIDLS